MRRARRASNVVARKMRALCHKYSFAVAAGTRRHCRRRSSCASEEGRSAFRVRIRYRNLVNNATERQGPGAGFSHSISKNTDQYFVVFPIYGSNVHLIQSYVSVRSTFRLLSPSVFSQKACRDDRMNYAIIHRHIAS